MFNMNPQSRRPGTVYLVGAGPGDPGLITVRGLEILRRADAVVFDALANAALLDEAPAHAIRIDAGKRANHHTLRQEKINETLEALAWEHGVVVRLKAGDPFVFGRGREEVSWLQAAGVPVEVVPGVSSAFAAAESVGVPLTHRGVASAFAVVTGHMAAEGGQEPDWNALARIATLVILMGLGNAARIAQRLIEAGRAPGTPVLIVAAATLPEQESVATTLAELPLAVAQITPGLPATIVVGEVVRIAGQSVVTQLAQTLSGCPEPV